jgi:hypothetical protein
MITLLFIRSAQARNDGFQRTSCARSPPMAFHPEHGHERKRAGSEGSFEHFFVCWTCQVRCKRGRNGHLKDIGFE